MPVGKSRACSSSGGCRGRPEVGWPAVRGGLGCGEIGEFSFPDIVMTCKSVFSSPEGIAHFPMWGHRLSSPSHAAGHCEPLAPPRAGCAGHPGLPPCFPGARYRLVYRFLCSLCPLMPVFELYHYCFILLFLCKCSRTLSTAMSLGPFAFRYWRREASRLLQRGPHLLHQCSEGSCMFRGAASTEGTLLPRNRCGSPS